MQATVQKTLPVYDCTDHIANLDNLVYLNEYFQKNCPQGLEFESFKTGPDHMPSFTCQTEWEGQAIIRATAYTKKDAKKKIKSYIWNTFFHKIIQTKEKKSMYLPRVAEYSRFRDIIIKLSLLESSQVQKPALIVDMTTIDPKILDSPENRQYCQDNFSKIIMLASGKPPEWKEGIVLQLVESNNSIVIECLKRIAYYLIDSNFETEVRIVTRRVFPGSITTQARKTKQTISVSDNLKIR